MSTVGVTWFDSEAVRRALDAYVGTLVREHPEVDEVILFGSVATGTAVRGSDVDLLLILSAADRPFLDVASAAVIVDVPRSRSDGQRRLQRAGPYMPCGKNADRVGDLNERSRTAICICGAADGTTMVIECRRIFWCTSPTRLGGRSRIGTYRLSISPAVIGSSSHITPGISRGRRPSAGCGGSARSRSDLALDRVELPLAGHAFELNSLALPEANPRAGHKVLDRA
ncbi:MAG: nucleotidyltransferase domain-containing protein [Candidatus Rokubacteria bacterium]|nr:nucleotidyltransferase domain-containing protein [Candidatus Rokubacteria bacterium]